MTKELIREQVFENITQDIQSKINMYGILIEKRKKELDEMYQCRYDDMWSLEDEQLLLMYETNLDVWTECKKAMLHLLSLIEILQ